MIVPINKKKLETFLIYTLGCKTNQSESDSIAMQLVKKGMRRPDASENCDLFIINTCTVTAAADKKSRQFIRQIKQKFPDSLLLVTGCFTVLNEDFFAGGLVDILVRNDKKSEIPGLITGPTADTAESACSLKSSGKEPVHSRALMKIQDGCEQGCAYCIVPLVRGPYKSTPTNKIIDEIKDLISLGYEEVVLTGIHIGKYGIDIQGKKEEVIRLPGLVAAILDNTDIRRIRLSSIETDELTGDLVDMLAGYKGRIARHLHIPLQSGSTKILGLMGRPYSATDFLQSVERLKRAVPEISITTDIIAGFPQETDEDFNETLKLVEKAGFSRIHVFKYSVRDGTKASLMPGRIIPGIIDQRSERLRSIGYSLRKRFMISMLEKTLSVVCEKYDISNGLCSGMSEEYIKIYFPIGSDEFSRKRKKILMVRPKTLFKDGISGELL